MYVHRMGCNVSVMRRLIEVSKHHVFLAKCIQLRLCIAQCIALMVERDFMVWANQ